MSTVEIETETKQETSPVDTIKNMMSVITEQISTQKGLLNTLRALLKDTEKNSKELDKYRKEYARTHPKDSPPYSALQLSAVAGMSVQDIQELMEKASFGMTVSSSSAIGGDEEAEDERTIEDTLTASGSLEENEESLIRSMDSQLVQKASTVMTLEERKFLDQIRRGFSVVATAKRMGISRTKATTLKRNVMAHLSMAGST